MDDILADLEGGDNNQDEQSNEDSNTSIENIEEQAAEQQSTVTPTTPSDSSTAAHISVKPIVLSRANSNPPVASSGGRLPKPEILHHELPLEVNVTRPQKVGDGVSAYVVYTVSHTTQLPHFNGHGDSVRRRFSDFLTLWELLKERYAREGILLPPRPEKSILGAAKVKVAGSGGGNSEDHHLAEDEFVERRRGELERFLIYCCQHPKLRLDTDLRDFLEKPSGPAKPAGSTGVGGVLKAFTNAIGSTVAAALENVQETDQWFEDKIRTANQQEVTLRQLLGAANRLARERREYARQSRQLSESLARLKSAEGAAECQAKRLTVALDRLADTQETISRLQACQAECELSELCEQVRHQLAMLESLRASAQERQRLRRAQVDAETSLAKKKEERGKLERTGRTDKLAACDAQIGEAEKLVEKSRADFEAASATIKTECERLDIQLGYELRSALLCTLEHQLLQQQQVVDAWTAFLPDARRILPDPGGVPTASGSAED